MLTEQFKQNLEQYLKSGTIAFAGFMSGAVIALVLMQYSGSFEFRHTPSEMSIRVDGRSQCEVISE